MGAMKKKYCILLINCSLARSLEYIVIMLLQVSLILYLFAITEAFLPLTSGIKKIELFSNEKAISSRLQGKKFLRDEEWAKKRGMVPGFGGLWQGDPNAEKFKVTIKSKKAGEEYTCLVPKDRYIFYVFEEEGIDLPLPLKERMCRQGCCTICSMKVVEGKSKMDAPLGLLKELREEGYTLTCCTYPKSDMVLEMLEEDQIFIKQWSEGFEGGGVEWGGFLPEED